MNDLISRQAAIDQIECLMDDKTKVHYNHGCADATATLKNLPPAQQWIPIDKDLPDKKELPDNFIDVLISIEDAVFIAYRLGIHWHISGGGEKFIDFADAWMPAPKPYRED